VRLIDAAGALCAALALVPVYWLSAEERSGWQCLGVFIVVSLVGAVEVSRAAGVPGRARVVFGRICWTALPGMGAAVVLAMSSGPCAPWAAAWNAGWALLPSVGLAAAVGVFAGTLSPRLAGAASLIVAIAIAFVVHDTAWALGSASYFAFDHLGLWSVESSAATQQLYLPGRAVAFRLSTLGWAAVLVGAVGGPGGGARAWVRAVATPLCAAVGFGALALGTGLLHTHSTLALRLGERAEVAGYRVHYERNIPGEARALFEEELRFHHQQLAALFGERHRAPVRVFVYASSRRLVELTGADRSAFAFPHHLALHVALEPAPHSALRHELVHVLAGAWAADRSGQPGEWLLGEDHGGLVEGLAEALGQPEPSLALHRAAAAMRKLEVLPDARELLVDGGFRLFDEDLAYPASGSFVRFVIDRHGVQAVRALYGNADYLSATGHTLGELATAWEAFLETVPVPERDLALVREQSERSRADQAPCWREAEACRNEGWGAGDMVQAERAFRLCLRARPGDLDCRLGLAEALYYQWRTGDAWRPLIQVLREAQLGSARRARALVLAGQLELSRRSDDMAVLHFGSAQRDDPDPWTTVEARALLAAATHLRDEEMDVDKVAAQLRAEVAGDPLSPFSTRLALWWFAREEWTALADALLRWGAAAELPQGARAALAEELVRQAWREGDCGRVERLLVAELDPLVERADLSRHFRDRCAFRHREAPTRADVAAP
jgi:hypothetical protein